jgi:AmmeMemoRadiSam system protein B
LRNPEFKTRPPKCAGRWYPRKKQPLKFSDDPVSSAVISPHAGFVYSGEVSLEAVSYVKKNRVWIFGTCHYESPRNGISIFYGDYSSSIGKAVFPQNLPEKDYDALNKYFSDEGHRTEEHSIENVLYCLNHFKKEVNAFCVLVRINDEDDFEKIADDIAKVWNQEDSIIVSTDWNHFVPVKIINQLLEEASSYLTKGDIPGLYRLCLKGGQEACGIDGLLLAYKILSKMDENTKFAVLTATDSSKSEYDFGGLTSKTCVGYISARN